MNGFPAEIGAPLQTLLFLLAGGFGAGCFIHAVAARDGGRRTDHLLLSCICLLACGYLALEACGLHLTDLVALAAFRKTQMVLSCTFIAVNAWFSAVWSSAHSCLTCSNERPPAPCHCVRRTSSSLNRRFSVLCSDEFTVSNFVAVCSMTAASA